MALIFDALKRLKRKKENSGENTEQEELANEVLATLGYSQKGKKLKREKTPTPRMDMEAVARKIQEELKKSQSTSWEEKDRVARDIFLQAKEDFQNQRIAESGPLKKRWAATEKWWTGMDATKSGRIGKTMLSAALMGGATIGSAALLGYIPSSVYGAATKLVGRVGLATAFTTGSTGLNMFLASGKMAQINENIKENSELYDIKDVGRALRGATMAGGLGFSLLMGGWMVVGIGAGGMVARAGLNYASNKYKENLERKKRITLGRIEVPADNFDIDSFAKYLKSIDGEYDSITRSLRNARLAKNILGGALTIGTGVATLGALSDMAEASSDDSQAVRQAESAAQEQAELTPESRANLQDSSVPPLAPEATPPPAESFTEAIPEQPQVGIPIQEPEPPLTRTIDDSTADALVHKGEGITHPLARQIEENGELARALGYKGDMDDARALQNFTRGPSGAAYKLAGELGYVNAETGEELRVGPIDEIAYKLSLNSEGKIEVEELRGGGATSVEKHTQGETSYEGDAKERYEYKETPKYGEPRKEVASADTPTQAQETPTQAPTTEEVLEKAREEIRKTEELEERLPLEFPRAPEKSEPVEETPVEAEENKQTENSRTGEVEEVRARVENAYPRPDRSTGVNYTYDSETGPYGRQHPFDGESRIGAGFGPDSRSLRGERFPDTGQPGDSTGTNYTFSSGTGPYGEHGPLFYDFAPGSEIPPDVMGELNLPSEFTKNHFGLSPGEIWEVRSVYEENLDKLLPQDESIDWSSIKNVSARDVLANEKLTNEPVHTNMLTYLGILKEETGLEPRGGMFRTEETLGQYIVRALEKAADNGKLDAIRDRVEELYKYGLKYGIIK